MGWGCCSEKQKKEELYKCETCGGTSDKARDCCGKPMKKQK